MNSSLLELLFWEGKTTQSLKFFRQSLRKDIQSVLDGDHRVSLRDIWETIESFLKISGRLVHAKWERQKEQLALLVTALWIFTPQDILFEHKILSETNCSLLMKPTQKERAQTRFAQMRFAQMRFAQMRFAQMRFATLADFVKLKMICAEERAKSGSSLILSSDFAAWLSRLIWVKRVTSERKATHAAKDEAPFVYPRKGLTVCGGFDGSDHECRPGLHVTILLNQSAFYAYGTQLLLVTIPMFAEGKPNEIVIISRSDVQSELSPCQIKLRTRALEVLGESHLLGWSLPGHDDSDSD